MKTRVTVESITDELNGVLAGATADKQFGAARAAIETKAKLHDQRAAAPAGIPRKGDVP